MSNTVLLPTARHQVAIAGRVVDAHTMDALAGAQVEITAAPSAFEERQIAPVRQAGVDGLFHFTDLPDGNYTLAISLPGVGRRYGLAQTTATVSRDTAGAILLATADVALPPTGVAGTIMVDPIPDGEPVSMARVRVEGSGEVTWSDQSGNYALAGLEPGTRTLRIAARGYQTATATVSIGQGVMESFDVGMTPG